MWSIGAFLELDDRQKLEQYIRTNGEFVLDLPRIEDQSEDTMFDYFVNDNGEWQHWLSKVEEYVYPTDSTPEYGSILVPNVDNVRTDFLIHTIAKQQKVSLIKKVSLTLFHILNLKAALLIGEQGTAKTVIIKSYMDKFNVEEYIQKSLNFSSATTPNMFQVRTFFLNTEIKILQLMN